MSDISIITRHSALIAVADSADVAVTLAPQRVYELSNESTNPIFFSTDGEAVAATDTQGADKFKILGTGAVYGMTRRITGVTTLKAKSTGGAAVLSITVTGAL